ncbi:DUF1765-domain-containing protein, partial [Rhizodiscina lignyota]
SAPPTSISKSFSLDRMPYRMPSLKDSLPSFDRLPALSRNASDKALFTKSDPARRRDELWTYFKALDADYQKFHGKSSSVKATIVRASLLPFLRAHSGDTSARNLRAEDLEKRVNVLNKWWAGLLEVLNGLNNQSMSGTDRPVLLDGVVGIMERPEWRAPPSEYSPLTGRSSTSSHQRTHSSSSTDSSSSDFLADSIHHNIRNIFVQNILTQMGFVVEKMSLKNTPASVVAFCGKACAYAFFFCPGVAKFLVSLWKLTMDPMRRILDEYGVPRHSIMGDVSKRVCSAFPSHLQELRLVSLTMTLRSLQHNPTPPFQTAHYNWFGPWVNKWAGRDSDLFYMFFKNYHMLATDFLPHKAKKLERICAPGLLMVHAQLLTTLDATIHRNPSSAPEEPRNGASSTTFDDLLNDADASAPAVPVPGTNAIRLMAENRVIMLLRDCLSDRSFNSNGARHFSAQCLSHILQAAARKTSLFDHNACFTLCDFLEEAVPIFVRYDNGCAKEDAVFEWSFWTTVWRKMVESQNTTTEIRVYALLYTIWNLIAEDADRKVDFCVNFLLASDIFLTRFNHWCPMVRGYYMRLLSWRVARYDASASPLDTTILAKLMERLSTVWSFFLFTRQLPGTDIVVDHEATPGSPAPGRRLLIIRTDPSTNPNGGTLLSFDDTTSATQSTRPRRNSWVDKMATGDWRPDSADSSDSGEQDEAPRRWSLLRNVIDATSIRSKSQSPKPTGRDTPDSGRSSPPVKPDPPRSEFRHHTRQRSGSMPAAPRHRTYCFKFSLEHVDRRFHNQASIDLRPPRLPLAAQQHLLSNYNLDAMYSDIRPTQPDGAAAGCGTYTGRALAEWTAVVTECQNFFERRIREGVPSHRLVETPMLGVETFKRPG